MSTGPTGCNRRRWAIRPPMGVRTEGSLFWELPGRRGLYNSRAVLDEIAREILYFSAVVGPVPETGIDLRSNLLAGWARTRNENAECE